MTITESRRIQPVREQAPRFRARHVNNRRDLLPILTGAAVIAIAGAIGIWLGIH